MLFKNHIEHFIEGSAVVETWPDEEDVMEFKGRTHTASRWSGFALISMLLAVSASFAQQPGTRRSVPRAKPNTGPVAASAAQGSQPKFKGIWEPVSYPDDLRLADVFFTTADEGWVAGGTTYDAGGLILHTTDGGDHWEIQLGDPQSSENGYKELRFLDGTHGWAVQRRSGGNPDRLLHTRDGKNWSMIGPMPGPHMDYMFTSERNGVVLREGSELDRTTDGGKTWKPAFECATKVQVDGLWQNMGCRWGRLHFVTPSTGFAIGNNNRILFVAKTTDGGATWRPLSIVQRDENWPRDPDVFFLDENTGFLGAEQAYKSLDGGLTWTGIAASSWRPLHLRFADPEVGWAVNEKKVTFTTDGGNRWTSRDYPFPTEVAALSLPRRDRGYVVGDHGMIFRYRIVPADYAAKGLIPAPLLSGIDSPLDDQIEQLAQQVQKLAQDTGVPAGSFPQDAGSSGAAMTQTGSSPSFTGTNPAGNVFSAGLPASIPGCPGVGAMMPAGGSSFPSTTTSIGGTTPPASSGGFTQDTTGATTAGGPAPDTIGAAPASGPASAISSGFAQDTNAASETIASVSTTVPQFVSKYRNLNLLLTGIQVAAQMPATVQCLKQSLQALKAVRNPQTAMAAVTTIQGQVTGLVQMMHVAFQKAR